MVHFISSEFCIVDMNEENICKLSDALLVNIRAALPLIKTQQEANRWRKHLHKLIVYVKKIYQHSETLLDNRYKLKGILTLLKSYSEKLKLQAIKIKTDAEIVSSKSNKLIWQDVASSYAGRIKVGVIINNVGYKEPMLFFEKAKILFEEQILKALKVSILKVNVIFTGVFNLPVSGRTELKTFNTKNNIIDRVTNLQDWFLEHVQEIILNELSEYQERESGWTLNEIIHLKVNINNYSPISGTSWVDLPEDIKRKHAIINVKNRDNYCFLWAVTSALHPSRRYSNRPSTYPHYSFVLRYDGIDFPMQIKDIPKFEELNSLRINLFTLETIGDRKNEVVPISLSKTNHEKTINLLLYSGGDENENYHYMWIKSLSRLLRSQLTASATHKVFLCNRCLNHFKSEINLNKHLTYCGAVKECRIETPDAAHQILSFQNFKCQDKVPFTIYADIKSILKKNDDNNNNSINTQKHIASSISYYVKCSYNDSLSKFKLYRGQNCINWFIDQLKEIARQVDEILNAPASMIITPVQEIQCQNAKFCHVCQKKFLPTDKKIRDHCHFTGKYRGPAHNTCNLKYHRCQIVSIVFHNLSNHDAHFIIKNLATQIPGRVKILPVNKEGYISFAKFVENTKIQFRVIDSFRFMASSLDKLASYLQDVEKPITRNHCNSDVEFHLATTKGAFPNEYIDSWEKYDETKFPQLNKYAQKMWSIFNIQTLGEYSDLYLKMDVLLLADVFENFRETCLQAYNLDPLHYFTAPRLALDAMLKKSGVELELMTDVDMILFIEKGIRGGVSQCSNRYGKANHKYMGDKYNKDEPDEYLMYYAINNLYDDAMRAPLPYGGFEWVEIFDNIDLINIKDDSDVGYILEVDLEYNNNLHSKHKDLPLCPEYLTPPLSNTSKLITSLYNKKNYIIHYKNLKQCLDLGLKLTTIHRVLKFKQKPWLRTFIDLNSELRAKCDNEFKNNFFKLMNSAIVGKIMENVRSYREVKLLTKWNGRYGAKSYISQPNFHSCTILGDDVVLIEMNKKHVIFNKPTYVGFCVLDISKTKIYDFHYHFIKKTIGENAKLLYTDTNSLIYSIKNVDIYEIMNQNLSKFDTSDYKRNNIFNIPRVHSKVIGLMKDENNGKIMTEFIGLRSKMYCYKILNSDDKKISKKAKKITAVTSKTITFNDYYNCLFNDQNLGYTVTEKELSLDPHDDKRIINYISTDTFPWGFDFEKNDENI